MSCEIRPIAQLFDIIKCKKWLLEKDDLNNESWLQESLVSLSSTGEVLVIAKGNKLIVLTSKWDSAEMGDIKMKYHMTWQGIPCSKSGDITSVLCLPLLSQNQTANGSDWTCIIVGFSSGTIKFYTENMNQLLSEALHLEPILRIKCSSFKAGHSKGGTKASDQESNESVYVLYKSVMCVVNGSSLFQTLRDCRNKLSRSSSYDGQSLDTNFPVDFKKYSFSDQDAITDAAFIGQTLVNIYDHLLTASLTGGFNCNYRPSPPQTSLIVATGRKPFLGFHYTVEGGGNAVLTDVALAVASKIKESVAASLPGWFGFGSSEPEKTKVAQEPAEQLRCRFGLCDLWRHGNTIITSPDCKLSAVTDSLGRIFLMENSSGIARRLWKGYREAQCGFLEVEEDVEKSRHRKSKARNTAAPRLALFIVIYAPKRGLIEIFGLERGPCVASFRVSKNGILIYTPHGLLGFNNTHLKGYGASHYPVVFLSEEGVREIVVPFHCALRSDNSNKARDLHILKKMKLYLKESSSDGIKLEDDMKAFAKDFKTEEIKVQVLEMLTMNKQITPSAFMAVLNVFMENNKTQDKEKLSRSFSLLVESLERLLAFYIFLKDLDNQPPSYKTVTFPENSDSFLIETLLLTDKELCSISKLMNTVKDIENRRKGDIKVKFEEKNERNLPYFLSCFDFNIYANSALKDEEKIDLDLSLKTDLREEKLKWIGEFLFRGIFYSDTWISDWKTYVGESKLNRLDLIKCLISYWLDQNKSDNLTSQVASLLELVKAICSLVDSDIIFVGYTKHSPWWQEVRNFLKTSPCSISSLLVALVCRAVTIKMEQMKEIRKVQSEKKPISENETHNQEVKADGSQNNEWENVSQDTWEWDILITKLEDLTLLNSVLNINFKNFESVRPILDFQNKELSLNDILAKGDGCISEIVAKWLVQFAIDPCSLIGHTDIEFRVKKLTTDNKREESEIDLKQDVTDTEKAASVNNNDMVQILLDYISILKEKFPYSLTSSSLLGNMCWEYMAYWFKNPNQLSCLETAVDYLRTIPSVNLKHGLSYLSWTTYVTQKFASVAKLINKFGKVPKDKFCMQEVNLTNIQVPVFLKLSTEILNLMLETGTAEKIDFICNQEGIWQNDATGNIPSLVTRSLSHPKINDELLLLHYQLSLTLYMIAELNFKMPKLFSSIFDNVAQTEFFTDFAKNSQLSGHSCNMILTNSRKQFLYKVIAGAVQTMEVIESIPPFPVESTDYVPETRVNVEKATKWISLCFDLARMWDIPLDDLRRHHVCELYSCGFDRLAEEILPAVNESSALASQLLVIAGERLKVYIHGSSSLSKKLSNLSPNLSTWLECLDTDNLKHHSVDLNDICTMLSYILKWHPVKADDERLAEAMAESIPSLENDGYNNLILIILKMDPLYLALSFYKRRNYEKCKKITTELLASNPYDQAVWVLKMKSLTEELYVDDVEIEEEGIADTFLNTYIIAENAKPGTSLLNPSKDSTLNNQEMRPKSEAGRPITGVVRPGTSMSGRPQTMEQLLKTPRTGRTIRPITSQSCRNIRLGTASMLSEAGGQFIEVSRLNLSKYAQGQTAKQLFEYLYYHENDVQHALQLAIEAIQACSYKDWWWRVQLGKCYFTLNMIRDAETNFRLALNQHSNIDIYLRLIRVYIRLDQPLSAISVCKKALDFFPKEVSLLIEIARLYELLNDLTLSIDYYREIIIQDAVNIEAIACIAVHYFYTDQPEVALKFFRRLLQIGIVNAALFNNLGLCCFYSQQFDLSLGCFQRALALAEGEELADVWYNISHIAISIGDLNLAIHCLRLCLAADGNHASAFNNLGVIEARRNHISKARAYFKVAERMAPFLFEPHFNLAKMSYQHGDLQTSYIAIQKAAETNTKNANCIELLNKLVKHFSSI